MAPILARRQPTAGLPAGRTELPKIIPAWIDWYAKPAPDSSIAGYFATTPKGFILHGSRSGHPQSARDEWRGTCNYAMAGANGLGWHATIGPNVVGIHMAVTLWGYNAREHSDEYIAVEFAQPTVDDPIDDAQVTAFAWYVQHEVYSVWPDIPRFVICHSELAAGIRDGKADAFPIGPLADAFKARVLASL